MDFTSRYRKLNERQKEAVDSIDGPLMVIAGPGTGKTELLSMRTANILQKTDTLPENILCLTFTESGATAMRERLREIIGQDAYKVAIHTFHSFGSEIINQNGEYFYHGADFRPADELSAYELLRDIFDSLDYNNPLASKMNGEYTHLGDVLTVISELKKSGLTSDELLQVLDANETALDSAERELAQVFASRISAKTLQHLQPIVTTLAEQPAPAHLPPGIPPLAGVLSLSLAHAIDHATDSDSTKPITAWKNTYLEKNEQGSFVFKDRKRIDKLRAVSFVYYQYLLKMQESELYDFDDMVLRVVHAMEVFPELRFNLQEKYLYIMVDEFQDTNLAQMRILHNLTADLPDAQPNLMVVGDDDQAIYSFQGAEVGNILGFRDRYETSQLVALTDNYRSAETVLSTARTVITQGSSRLEQYIDHLDKSLTAHHSPPEASVSLAEYAHVSEERSGLVERIQAQIKSGIKPGDIAVLARRHHELIALLPYFYQADVAVNYERRDNVLENEAVAQLILTARVVMLVAAQRFDEAEVLLPEVLAHPAWNISPEQVWKLSLKAHKNRSSWLEEMSTQPDFQTLHLWLIATSRDSLRLPLEELLDRLMGTPDSSSPEADFASPLYEYFFSGDVRHNNPAGYLEHLEALRTIRAHLRDYKPGRALKLADFVEFVQLHQQLGSIITSVRGRSDGATDAVHLMTAHKSKGLEFNHVHIVGAIDTSWGEKVRSRSRLISYPENLPLAPAGNSYDERLRLFFVALTRARNSCSISYSLLSDSNKPTLLASFLSSIDITSTKHDAAPEPSQQLAQQRAEWYQPYTSMPQASMRTLLAPTLEAYKLSVTHLNNFLDVTRGGPRTFLLNNLLRFPQAMGPQAAYGSAIHRTLQRAHMHVLSSGKQKPHEDVLQDFEHSLRDQHLSDDDFSRYLQRGTDSLSAFLANPLAVFHEQQQTELNFAHQQSRVGEARLSGALDVATIDKKAKTISVIDYKTGSPSLSWQGKTDYEKVKLHKYRQQLMFYRLLIENSRDYRNYHVTSAQLVFVEPTKRGDIAMLEADITSDDLQRFKQLIETVWQRIMSLDLPDTSAYSHDYKGMLSFEDDLLT